MKDRKKDILKADGKKKRMFVTERAGERDGNGWKDREKSRMDGETEKQLTKTYRDMLASTQCLAHLSAMLHQRELSHA